MGRSQGLISGVVLVEAVKGPFFSDSKGRTKSNPPMMEK